jgi:hypothetical protein
LVGRAMATVRMPGVPFSAGATDYSFPHSVQTGSGTQPASYPTNIGGSFAGVKLGLEADHSTSPSAMFKNGGAIPPLPHPSLWNCLIN